MVTRQQKEEIVSALKAKSQESNVALVADFKGLSVADFYKLRKSMKGIAKCVVAKNTLAKLAFKNGNFEALGEFLSGPSVVMFGEGEDPTSAIKSFFDIKKTFPQKLELKGGVFKDEAKALNAETLQAISKLPAKEVLLAQIAGALTATPSTVVNSINQIISGIADLAVQVAEKQNNQ